MLRRWTSNGIFLGGLFLGIVIFVVGATFGIQDVLAIGSVWEVALGTFEVIIGIVGGIAIAWTAFILAESPVFDNPGRHAS